MLIKAAINGTRAQTEHPAIPVTAEQQAEEAKAAVAAGAGAIHVHVRGANAQESLAPEDVSLCLEMIRAACPGIPVGISTGAWIIPDLMKRLALIQEWEVLPDFASVNIHEEGAELVIKLLLDLGVGVEAGVWNPRAAKTLVRSGLAKECLRILIETGEEAGDAKNNLAEIESALGQINRPILLHGLDDSAWEMVELAAMRNYDTRTGFEDTLTLPDGSRAENNAVLIADARRIAARCKIAIVAESWRNS